MREEYMKLKNWKAVAMKVFRDDGKPVRCVESSFKIRMQETRLWLSNKTVTFISAES